VLDLRIVHDRFGSSSDPNLNGHLHYPNVRIYRLNQERERVARRGVQGQGRRVVLLQRASGKTVIDGLDISTLTKAKYELWLRDEKFTLGVRDHGRPAKRQAVIPQAQNP
jgi:hypothetical protein